jgi:hypothetical protein
MPLLLLSLPLLLALSLLLAMALLLLMLPPVMKAVVAAHPLCPPPQTRPSDPFAHATPTVQARRRTRGQRILQ